MSEIAKFIVHATSEMKMSKEKDWKLYSSKLEKENERLRQSLKRANGKIEELENRLRNNADSPTKAKSRRNSKSKSSSKSKSPLLPNPIRNLSIIHKRVSEKKVDKKAIKSPPKQKGIGQPSPPLPPKKINRTPGKLDKKLLAFNNNLNESKPDIQKKKETKIDKAEPKKTVNQKPETEKKVDQKPPPLPPKKIERKTGKLDKRLLELKFNSNASKTEQKTTKSVKSPPIAPKKKELNPPPPPLPAKKIPRKGGKLNKRLLGLNINLGGLKPGAQMKRKPKIDKAEPEKTINQAPKIDQAMIQSGKRRKRSRKRRSSLALIEDGTVDRMQSLFGKGKMDESKVESNTEQEEKKEEVPEENKNDE